MMHSRMAPRKLSDSDKQQIASIYCQPGETTSTLATKFGISSSTVSRVLKQVLPDKEYAKLMKWKRSGERGSFPLASSDIVEQLDVDTSQIERADDTADLAESSDEANEKDVEAAESKQAAESAETIKAQSNSGTARRSRRRSGTNEVSDEDTTFSQSTPALKNESASKEPDEVEETAPPSSGPQLKSAQTSHEDGDDDEHEVAAWVSEGLEDPEDYDEDSEEDWDEEDWDDDSDEDESDQRTIPREAELTIHSFDSFSFAKPCYLVVDRMAELITCPLKDFSELGVIPSGEEHARTLPVFDNHRIARRFARRNQRIIKVPDSLMLNKTQEYLQAKGITRILFDGQVYALATNS